jgi:hypothetical protein
MSFVLRNKSPEVIKELIENSKDFSFIDPERVVHYEYYRTAYVPDGLVLAPEVRVLDDKKKYTNKIRIWRGDYKVQSNDLDLEDDVVQSKLIELLGEPSNTHHLISKVPWANYLRYDFPESFDKIISTQLGIIRNSWKRIHSLDNHFVEQPTL